MNSRADGTKVREADAERTTIAGQFMYDVSLRLLLVAIGDLPWMTVTSEKSCDWFSVCLP